MRDKPPLGEVALLFKNEIAPLQDDIISITKEVVALKITPHELLTRHKLDKIDKDCSSIVERWADICDKIFHTDKILPDGDKEPDKLYQLITIDMELLLHHRDEVSRLMDIALTLVSDKRREYNETAAIYITSIAAIVSIVALLIVL